MQALVRHRLFTEAECQDLLSQVQGARAIRSGVTLPGTSGRTYDETMRKTLMLTVPDTLQARVTYRLMSLLPELESTFGVELMGCQAPQFLAYQPGDFFQRHSDVLPDDAQGPRRLVSVVIFLNAGQAPPAGYTGGELILYPEGEVCEAASGDLIAFASQRLHEVRPVLSGLRYSIVSWFY